MFTTRLLYAQKSLPLLVEPEEISPAARSVSSLIDSILGNRALVDSWLHEYGAILFRGFSIDTIEEFDAAVRAIQPAQGGEPPLIAGRCCSLSTPTFANVHHQERKIRE